MGRASRATRSLCFITAVTACSATKNLVDEPDGWDETIVPYDSGRDPEDGPNTGRNHDIIDDELGNRFDKLRKNTRLITFIFDSCHSGDATKDIDQPREAPRDSHFPTPEEISSRGLAGDGKRDYAMFSGCQSNEKSYETFLEGQYHGTLTYFLTKAIDQPGVDQLTYQDVFNRLKIDVNASKPAQHPQLDGTGVNRVVFGAKAITSQPYVLVQPQGDLAIFEAGQVHGMTVRSVFDVYLAGTRDFNGPPTAKFVLTEVNALTSKGTRLEGGPIQKASCAVERVHNYENAQIRVYFDDTIFDPVSKQRTPVASRLRDAVLSKMQTTIRLAKGFTKAKSATDAAVAIRLGRDAAGQDALVFSRPGSPDQTRTLPPGGDDQSIDRIMEELSKSAPSDAGGSGNPVGLFLEDRNELDEIRYRLDEARALASTFSIVDRDGVPDIVVRRERQRQAVSLFRGGPLLEGQQQPDAISPPVQEEEDGGITHVLNQLKDWAKWIRLSKLENTGDARLASVETRVIAKDGQVSVFKDDRPMRVKLGDKVQFNIKNLSDGEVFVSILDLSGDGEISKIHPPGVPQLLPRDGVESTQEFPTQLKDQRGSIRDEIRVIVTKAPVDFSAVEQPAPKPVMNPLEQLMHEALWGQKSGLRVPPINLNEWSTIQRTLDIVR